MGEYSWVVQSDKFWTLRKHILDCSKMFLESVIKAYVPRGVYSWLLVPLSLGPRQTWVGGTNRGRIRPGQKGNGEGGGYQEEEGAREEGGRNRASEQRSFSRCYLVQASIYYARWIHQKATRATRGQEGKRLG